MKKLALSLITIFFNLVAIAQETPKANDAILLEYYQGQRYQDAEEYLKKTFPEPVTDLNILAKLAYTAQMAGKLADAEGYYQRVYELDSTKTSVLFNLGSINLRRKNYLKAEVFYKKIMEKDTGNFMVYKQLAEISFEKGEQAQNITYLTKANQINPADPDVASGLSDILINFKKYDQAEKVLGQAIISDPENIELLYSLVGLYSSESKFRETKETCLKLIQLGDKSAFVLTKIGFAYYNLKEYECAIDALLNIPTQYQGESVFYITGMAYKGLGDQPKTVEFMKRAIDAGISPDIADYYGEIGGGEEKLKKNKAAATAYQKALEFNEDPTILYLLANLYDTKLKDKKKAVFYYKRYIASNPSSKKQTYIAYSKSRIEELAK
jgi:tetratricopeptide (TPR) repeat protein